MAAKLPREILKLFGLTGPTDDFEQVGAFRGGAPNLSKVIATLQALDAWKTGLGAIVNDGNKALSLEDHNSILYVIFYQLCSIFQDGVPTWEAGTEYFVGSLVRKDGTGEIYMSLTDNNLGNALPSQADNSNWAWVNQDLRGSTSVAALATADGAGHAFTHISSSWWTRPLAQKKLELNASIQFQSHAAAAGSRLRLSGFGAINAAGAVFGGGRMSESDGVDPRGLLVPTVIDAATIEFVRANGAIWTQGQVYDASISIILPL